MKYPTVFHLVSAEFEKAKIPFILIGGFAVNAYKVSRNTNDIDFLIIDRDYTKVREIMERNGYDKKEENEVFARYHASDLRFIDIDFMFVDFQTFEKFLKESMELELAGKSYHVPSLFHLIALKLHALKNNSNRQFKDLPDILALIKNNDLNINTDEFRQLCLKFGTVEIYNNIRGFMK